MKVLIALLVVSVVLAVQAEHEEQEQRGLLSALNKRRSALAARISGIMRRSSRKSEKNADGRIEKNTDGRTFNQNSNRGYYQYQLNDDVHVYDSYTYYDEENPEKQTTETNDETNEEQRDGQEDYDEHNNQQQDNFYGQNEYTTGEYITNDSGNRRPFSSLISRLSSLFSGRRFNIDETRSVELINLINEQIDIENHIKNIQNTGQARAKTDESLIPLNLPRSKIEETTQGRQSGGVFIPLNYAHSQGNKDYTFNYNPYYQTSRPQGWVIKPDQQDYYTTNGFYRPIYKPSYPSYPVYFQPREETFALPQGAFPAQPHFEHQGEIHDIPRPNEQDVTSGLKEKLESIENQIDYIKTHTDATAGSRPQILFDLGVQGNEVRNKIKRIEYALEHNVSPHYRR